MNKKIIIIALVTILVIGFIFVLSKNSPENKNANIQSNIVLDEKSDIFNKRIIKNLGSKIEVNQKSYDFGVVKYGDIAEHIFKIKNVGTENLEILKLSTSCGCTKASIADKDKIILPGKSVDMLVTFDPAIHKDDMDIGILKRIVYIRTNDSENDEVEVEITANVLSPEKFKTINVTAQRWFFDPDLIKVKQGDYVELKIVSIDTYHSFTLLEYSIDAYLEPEKETVVKFFANKKGTFEFYCSVPCGGGHSSMRGKLIVE